jgi:hypothetical protein
MRKSVLFSIVGVVLGLPLSYFLQPGFVRAKLSLPDYVAAFPELFETGEPRLIAPVIVSCVVLALILGILGYVLDELSRKSGSA